MGRHDKRMHLILLALGLSACSRSALRDQVVQDADSDGGARADGGSGGGGAGNQPVCGNGSTEAGEECDDGDSVPADGCEPDCTRTRIISLAAGRLHSCVVFRGGAVRCWGANSYGAAGYGLGLCDAPPIPCTAACCIGDDEPAAAAPLLSVGGKASQVVASAHTCALLDDGRVRCWGFGGNGNLGHGNDDDIGDDELPQEVGDVEVGGAVVQIAAGGDPGGSHSCALLGEGQVRCWGYGANGALGYGNTHTVGDDETPASAGDVDVGGEVLQVVAGNAHTCALLNGGTVRCWGFGGRGRLGYGNTDNVGDDETPASAGDVDVGGQVTWLAAGDRHTCALLEGGRVRCWGFGGDGRLGYANTEDVGDDEAPAAAGDVAVGGTVVQLAAGADHTCAVMSSGALQCWGNNNHAELGRPELVTGCFSCTTDSKCCIGDDETPASLGPAEIGAPVVQASAGPYHTCALLDSGHLRCWGSGSYGQLGYGHTNTIGDDEPPSAAGDVPAF